MVIHAILSIKFRGNGLSTPVLEALSRNERSMLRAAYQHARTTLCYCNVNGQIDSIHLTRI